MNSKHKFNNMKAIITILVVLVSFQSKGQLITYNNYSKQSTMTTHTNMQTQEQGSVFELPKLPYNYSALEPYIDARTMEIHYEKHHAAYTNNLNAAIKGTDIEGKSIEFILTNISKQPAAIRNNGGGFYNHNLFWSILSPQGSEKPADNLEIAKAIILDFGSFEEFKTQFSQAATTRFGSGWAWLSVDSNGKLFVSSTANQDNPLMDVAEKKGTPILTLDVWEHAYYLNYQNRRVDYISAFYNIINWSEVNKKYNEAKK